MVWGLNSGVLQVVGKNRTTLKNGETEANDVGCEQRKEVLKFKGGESEKC